MVPMYLLTCWNIRQMRKIILHRHQENKYLKLEERIKTVSPLRIGISKNTGLSFVATKKWLWSMTPSKTNSSRNNLFYEFFLQRPPIFFYYLSCHLFSVWHLFLWPFLNCYASNYLFFFFSIPVYIFTIVHYWWVA